MYTIKIFIITKFMCHHIVKNSLQLGYNSYTAAHAVASGHAQLDYTQAHRLLVVYAGIICGCVLVLHT